MNILVAPLHNTTWASWFVAGVVLYYTALWLVSLLRSKPAPLNDFQPLVVTLVPARNEELVIEGTIRSLLELDYPSHLVIVLNDGSTDTTSSLAHDLAREDPRLIVVDRDAAIAGQGKSAVLNHGFQMVVDMLAAGDPRVAGREPSEIVLGIVDADGRLEPGALRTVAPYFADATTGQLQIGVKIQNASDNLLARMQDMEFVGFSSLVQVARDRIGSSGLGGNGQFTRLSALLSLGRLPWTLSALTEDLDLGLALVELGWVTRFTNRAHVYQQGLTSWRPLLRQRTRWIQGHYQCWKHLPKLMRARDASWAARIDLTTYLLLVVTVAVVSFNLVTGGLTALGLLHSYNGFLSSVPAGGLREALAAFFTLAPIVAFTVTYQRHSDQPLRWWEIPAFGFLFTLYSYVWVTVTARAWARIVMRRGSWTKTPRVVPAT